MTFVTSSKAEKEVDDLTAKLMTNLDAGTAQPEAGGNERFLFDFNKLPRVLLRRENEHTFSLFLTRLS